MTLADEGGTADRKTYVVATTEEAYRAFSNARLGDHVWVKSDTTQQGWTNALIYQLRGVSALRVVFLQGWVGPWDGDHALPLSWHLAILQAAHAAVVCSDGDTPFWFEDTRYADGFAKFDYYSDAESYWRATWDAGIAGTRNDFTQYSLSSRQIEGRTLRLSAGDSAHELVRQELDDVRDVRDDGGEWAAVKTARMHARNYGILMGVLVAIVFYLMVRLLNHTGSPEFNAAWKERLEAIAAHNAPVVTIETGRSVTTPYGAFLLSSAPGYEHYSPIEYGPPWQPPVEFWQCAAQCRAFRSCVVPEMQIDIAEWSPNGYAEWRQDCASQADSCDVCLRTLEKEGVVCMVDDRECHAGSIGVNWDGTRNSWADFIEDPAQ